MLQENISAVKEISREGSSTRNEKFNCVQQYLLSSNFVFSTVLGTGDNKKNSLEIQPVLMKFTITGEV